MKILLRVIVTCIWITILVWATLIITPIISVLFITSRMTQSREWDEIRDYKLWEWLRNKFFKFEIKGEINDKDRVIYLIYPSSQLYMTAIFMWALNPAFRSLKPVAHSTLFYVPLIGKFLGWIGAIRKCDLPATLETNSVYMFPKKDLKVLEIARKAKVGVVPVWCPKENSYYSEFYPFGRTILGIDLPMIIWGRWWCPILPKVDGSSQIIFGKVITPDEDNFELNFRTELSTIKN
jgi:hypothetical protein